MRKLILIGMTLLAATAFAADKKVSRKPASVTHVCPIRGIGPVIECAGGEVVVGEDGCNHCEMEPSCIKTPTLTCEAGWEPTVDHKGCYHCIEVRSPGVAASGHVDHTICADANNELGAYEYQVAAAIRAAHDGKVTPADMTETNKGTTDAHHDPEFDVTTPKGKVHVTCDDSGDGDCACSVGN